ncbi:MAG: DNA alkylation repair protein [Candidatus Omnitrophica bacterium]|nr:DNA alkylation repair protein [Candidatus Omnitrophota bacterium]
MTKRAVLKELKASASESYAIKFKKFFKTKPGAYAAKDIFIGVSVPRIRAIVKRHPNLNQSDIESFINSEIHEQRLMGLIFLEKIYSSGNDKTKKTIYDLYLKNIRHINNWDLVDISAPKIIGDYLLFGNKNKLYTLAQSTNLWERRIAIVATFCFIKNGLFNETFQIASILFKDKEDLIHKAVGWMLREVGKKDLMALEQFLEKHYRVMPRTMLRYAIEKFPSKKRIKYLKGLIRQQTDDKAL